MDIFKDVIDFYMQNVNYWTIAFFMIIESTFIPFPSEIIVPPAAYKAASGELNIYLVVLSATLGALIGSFINYMLSITLGRKIIYALADTKVAKMIMITKEKILHAENYFNTYGNSATLVGRLIPGIRQLISIPAGLARMNLFNFTLFTLIGAGLWNIILAVMGYFLYTQKELLALYYKQISIAFLIVGVLFFGYILARIFILDKKKAKNDSTPTS